MKKIININLSSRLIPIEDSAYEILRQYLDSLKRYFSQEEGADEIVSDIESRIAEIFQDKLRKGAHCITDVDVLEVKSSMGTPEQFDEDAKTTAGTENAKQSQFGPDPYMFARPRKRFYRDPEGKILGGVCGGLGAYFNIDPLVFRIVFALLAIGGFGTGIVVYFIIWIATPEALTAAEKLEMRGERVDVNNIKNTVQEEMNAFKQRMGGVGDDIKNFSQGRGKQLGNDAGNFINSLFIGLRNVLVVLAKGFFMFFAVVVLLLLVIGLVMATFFSTALFPKDLILADGIQTTLFWPTVVLLIGVPIISIVIFLLRKMSGVKQANKYAGITLGFLWVLGIVFCIWLVSSVVSDFRTGPVKGNKEVFYLKQPSTGKLILRAEEDMLDMDVTHFFDSKLRVVDDTAIINNINLRIIKSETADFQVEILKSSKGRTVADARRMIQQLHFQLRQDDSVLYIPSGFAIPRYATFRGQEIQVTIKVPVGKKLDIEREVHELFDFDRTRWRGEWWNWDDFNDNDHVELRMESDGFDNLNREEKKQEEPAQPKIDTTVPEAPAAPAPNDGRYRYKREPAKADTTAAPRTTAVTNTPVDNSNDRETKASWTRASINGFSFLFSMYRDLAKQ
ncbi:PspC domain-containing protein [uncultured Chitinophaga sp.]|uniref:PspC domain-containing protein n=1 Tax=uncultured Chitinophaga sp. TaxID=339340 RepID=UPI0025E9A0A2|nr:PspC domain-containing protein [uncultured Chitinophaga sp.]